MTDISSQRISRDPGFQKLLAVGLKLVTAEASVVKDMDPEQRTAYAARANALSAAVRSGAASTGGGASADLGELFGITEADADALMLRAQAGAKEFSASFPELASMDERRKLDALVEAIKRDSAVVNAVDTMLGANPAGGAAAESEKTCLAICLALLLLFTAAAIAMLILLVVGCVIFVVLPPLMVLCIIAAAAAMAAFIAIAFNIYGSCIANCQEAGGGD